MKIKKLFMLLIVSLFAISLVGCGKDKGGDQGSKGGNNDGNGGGGNAWVSGTIEQLAAKYNGFEIQYTTDTEYIYVGGKDNVYWVLHLSLDCEEAYSSSVVSEKDGDTWKSYYYDTSKEQFVSYGAASSNNIAATSANTYFIGYMQSELSSETPVTATL